MATFRYKARDKKGSPFVSTVEADSPKEVADLLRKQGLQIIYLEEPQKDYSAALYQGVLQRLKAASRPVEVVLFTRQLALMVRAGLPLVDGIEGIAQQDISPALKMVIGSLSENLRSGKAFSEALSQHPAFFPAFYVSMVKSGETAGILEEVLERLADIGERGMELKGRVRAALAYPVLLVFLSCGIVTFLLVHVLPRFFLIFEESGVVLPLPTRILLAVSFLLQKCWFLVPLGLIAVFYGFLKMKARPEGRYRIDEAILRIPFLGPLLLRTVFARAFGIMASLLKSGIAVVPALIVVEDLVGNQAVARALVRVREAVVGGASLSAPFRAEKIFPPTISQLVSVGERTGSLDETFRHLGNYYEREVERALRMMTSVLEPLLLLVVGSLVAFIALSVLLPIFQLIKVFRR